MSKGQSILIRFLSVAIFTEHLAIIWRCMAAFAPRLDMVTFHLVIFKVLSANGANAVLSAICRQLIPFIKRPQIEQSAGERVAVPAKQKFVNSFRLLHIFVLVQSFDLGFHCGGVVGVRVVSIIKVAPV